MVFRKMWNGWSKQDCEIAAGGVRIHSVNCKLQDSSIILEATCLAKGIMAGAGEEWRLKKKRVKR